MGGVQSGAHNLGEALWAHERQRQKCHREGNRCETQAGQSSTQDRRKLLKRTRSLAVISEDENRQDREVRHFHLSDSTFDLPRGHQLIPRAKLIDRNSLKDRLSKSQQHLSDSYERFNEAKSCHSRSSCGLHSIPPALASLPDPLPYSRGNRSDPDRLNILDWPELPRRYRSVQSLDTVSGLVDIVEDNWPIEGNRSIDCIYTQVKRKRKEHRSLDSILFEDDGELEYFDVLNLLPLSNVRLEFDEDDERRGGRARRRTRGIEPRASRALEYRESRVTEETTSSRSNATDEEKCKGHTTLEECFTESDEDSGLRIWRNLDPCQRYASNKRNAKERQDSEADEREDREASIEPRGRNWQACESTKWHDRESNEQDRESTKWRDCDSNKWHECESNEQDRESNWRDRSLNKWHDSDSNEQDRRPNWQDHSLNKWHDSDSNEQDRGSNPQEREFSQWRDCDSIKLGRESNERQDCDSKRQDNERKDRVVKVFQSRRRDRDSKRYNREREESRCFDETDGERSSPRVEPDKYRANVAVVTPCREEEDRTIEEAEDYKSIWISDNEDPEDMSRRPQVLKVVDSDVTKRRHRRSVVEIDAIEEEAPRKLPDTVKEENDRLNVPKIVLNGTDGEIDGVQLKSAETTSPEPSKDAASVEKARSFFEQKTVEKESTRNKQNEGRFERIVKETSSILGKACNAVKGSLGFEARSESSDLGLGSESGSDGRRRSMDDGVEDEQPSRSTAKSPATNCSEAKKGHGNLTRSRSCVDSIECQDDGPEFDHVRYKIVKSNVFSKNMFSSGRRDVTFDGLMRYLREYSFQELLLDNNVVIIEPVRAETVERKSSPVGKKSRLDGTCKIAGTVQKKTGSEKSDGQAEAGARSPKQSSIRKHFFYHPIRVNRELIDEELPDPDTVRNVRRMFEDTLKMKNSVNADVPRECKNGKSVSMRDLGTIDDDRFDEASEKAGEGSRSRCSSRAKDLTRLFESMEKSTSSNASVAGGKDEPESPRSESKTRIIAQSFEARSGHTSPSDSNSSKNKANRYHHHHHHHHHHNHNWDSGSVSSGVSSDYPDTDPGSGAHCSSSEDEDADCRDDDGLDDHGPAHYVSQDVLKKIRECGTSVTYYGGKVVNTYNGPLISPLTGNRFKRPDGSSDYVKFRLVKSNSCDSRLELTGRLVENRSGKGDDAARTRSRQRESDLTRCTIAETPSIEITTVEKQEAEEGRGKEDRVGQAEVRREPPVVIGLEPKREEGKDARCFKADFKLGSADDSRSNFPGRFGASALTRWQVNESNWKTAADDFGKMEFEEFEVLEDSLNTADVSQQRAENS